MKIRYTGTADEYRFTQADFTRHDVTGQGAVHFDAKNDFTAEVTDEAAKLLMQTDASFKEVTDESSDESSDAATPKDASNNSPDAGTAASGDSDTTIAG